LTRGPNDKGAPTRKGKERQGRKVASVQPQFFGHIGR
jgi:hypothetical protein